MVCFHENFYYIFISRTTTPNSLREHLKETLTKNLGGSASDIAETIEHIKNDEIFDTFNIDNENVESPPVQRKAFRQRSMYLIYLSAFSLYFLMIFLFTFLKVCVCHLPT